MPEFRAVSRDLVRAWGFLNRTVAGTDLSPSAVHALIETGNTPGLPARDLCTRLGLEKSSVSRMVRALTERGELQVDSGPDDARIKRLHLTPQGRKTLSAINDHAEAQVTAALARLDDAARTEALHGLRHYAAALRGVARYTQPAFGAAVTVTAGYTPGLTGATVALLAPRILENHPFGPAFETRIAADMAEFLSRLGAPRNSIWRAEQYGRIVGSISIDGEHLGHGHAHLRWFVVAPDVTGRGTGKRLLEQALTFCDSSGFSETHLWTLKGLDAARSLYERNGFTLAEEYEGDQWGGRVTEQKFIRRRP